MEAFIGQEGLTEEFETKDHLPVGKNGGEYRRSKRALRGREDNAGFSGMEFAATTNYTHAHLDTNGREWESQRSLATLQEVF